MDLTDKPVANPIVVLREEFDDWAILFNPDTAAAVGVNPVGVAIWEKMDGTKAIKEIVADIRRSFEDAPEAADKEITAFVDKLVEQGFVGYELNR